MQLLGCGAAGHQHDKHSRSIHSACSGQCGVHLPKQLRVMCTGLSRRVPYSQGAVSTAAELVERCRTAGVGIFHLAAAYRPDLSDVPPLTLARQQAMQSSSSDGALGLPTLGDDALLPAVTPAKVGPLLQMSPCGSVAARTDKKDVCHCAGRPRADSTRLLRQRLA